MVRAKADNKLLKPEDKYWGEWFSGLKEKDHDKFLGQLGLDDEDIDEWHHSHGKLDEVIAKEEEAAQAPSLKKARK